MASKLPQIIRGSVSHIESDRIRDKVLNGKWRKIISKTTLQIMICFFYCQLMGVDLRSRARREKGVDLNIALAKAALQVGFVRRFRSNLPIENNVE